MKNTKKPKIKLVIIFTIILSAFLITISLKFTYSSRAAVANVARVAYEIDQKNNDILTSEMFYDITNERADDWSKRFLLTGDVIEMLARIIQKKLIEIDKDYSDKYGNIYLTKYKNRDFFVDETSDEYDIYYWGNKDAVPSNILHELYAINSISGILKGMSKLRTKFFYSLYFLSVDHYVYSFPRIDSYYKDTKNSKEFNTYFLFEDFPAKRLDTAENMLVTQSMYSKPYRDGSGKVVITIKAGIYDNKNKLLGHLGVDLDFEEIREAMLNDDMVVKSIPVKGTDIANNFFFLLGRNNNIITFPQKYADLFSIPKDYLTLNDYLKDSLTKLTDSTGPVVKALGNEIAANPSGIEKITLKGEVYDVGFSTIEETGWTLGYVVRKDALLDSAIKTKKIISLAVNEIFRKLLWITLGFILFSFLILFYFFRFYILSPLQKIRNGIKKMADGNFDIVLKVKGTREIAELSSSFNYLGEELKTYMKNLKEEIEIRSSLEKEIEIAERIQHTFLPDISLFPTDGKFKLETRLNAAKNISGDFYDFFYIAENKIALLVADVSGKGLQAAFFMAISKAFIKNKCLEGESNPAKVLEEVNRILCLDNNAQMFVTVSLIFYNIENGTATYANAGHHRSIIVQNNRIIKVENLNNIALGIYDKPKYKKGKASLQVGNIAVLFTDGVPEAVSPQGEEYGEERLEQIILNNRNLSLSELCDSIMEDVSMFEDNARFDDITLLAFKRLK